jgi:anti-sigma B factor antagonist
MEDIGLDITIRSLVDCEVVALRGELDCQTAPTLADALSEATTDGRTVVVDLSELRFIDSSGLHVLMSGADGGQRILVCPPGNVARVLSIVRADSALPVYQELDAALDGVSDSLNEDGRASA